MAVERDQIDELLDEIDWLGWSVIVGDATSLLHEVARDAGAQSLVSLRIPDDQEIDLFDQVNDDALEFARTRGAELVGRRIADDGSLIENPNPKWAITDSTRNMLRSTVSQAIENGWSAKQLADAVQTSYAFSSSRASVIGRTEIARAQEFGTLTGWRRSGVVDKVQLHLGSEHDEPDECDDAADLGAVPIDDAGDIMPPLHPNCVCALEPVISEEGE